MHAKKLGCGLLLIAWFVAGAAPAPAQKKDYLSEIEADKIRDAETPEQRIKLFISFAADRIKKLQYDLTRPSGDNRRAERLNGLLNAYAGCVDDAAELIALAREKQQDIHGALKEMQARGKEFLDYLEELAAKGSERETYKDTLDDAIEATRDALQEADKAAKEIAPPPVRRKN